MLDSPLSMYRSEANDAHLVGGQGVTRARLEEIQNKPDSKTLKAARLAAEREEAIASAMANGVSRADAEAVADELGKKKARQMTIKTEDGETKIVMLDGDGNAVMKEDEEAEALLSPDESILILTGANASGKSVFLKSVAIIVYMVSTRCQEAMNSRTSVDLMSCVQAHIGSFVPAEKAVIGLTDKIMTRVSTRESVSRVSSFPSLLSKTTTVLTCINRA